MGETVFADFLKPRMPTSTTTIGLSAMRKFKKSIGGISLSEKCGMGGSISAFFAGRTRKSEKAKRKRLRRIDGASFVISVSISCGESGEKSKLRRDSDGLFSFVSYQYCQRQNNKGRQQNNAGVQNNHAVHVRTGESSTGGLCEVRCSCIGKELSHQTFLLS